MDDRFILRTVLPTPRQLAIVASLLGLIAINLALLTGALWLMAYRAWLNNLINHVSTGLLLGQTALIGFWFGLGDWRWYLRLPIVVGLSLAVAKCFGWTLFLAGDSKQEADPSMMLAFVILAIMLAIAIVAFMVRRFRGWRLTWQADAMAATATRQFQIADAMLWTVLVSGSLAALRFMAMISPESSGGALELTIYILEPAALAILALVAAFAPRWRIRMAALCIAVLLFIGAVAEAPDIWGALGQQRAMWRGPVPVLAYVNTIARSAAVHDCQTLSTFMIVLFNCLVLGRLGCRLVRPGQTESTAAESTGMPWSVSAPATSADETSNPGPAALTPAAPPA